MSGSTGGDRLQPRSHDDALVIAAEAAASIKAWVPRAFCTCRTNFVILGDRLPRSRLSRRQKRGLILDAGAQNADGSNRSANDRGHRGRHLCEPDRIAAGALRDDIRFDMSECAATVPRPRRGGSRADPRGGALPGLPQRRMRSSDPRGGQSVGEPNDFVETAHSREQRG